MSNSALRTSLDALQVERSTLANITLEDSVETLTVAVNCCYQRGVLSIPC